uniref:non-specific serine/threonine protein kinase n=1 Tax=Oryza punctata TaxID=4537 RepID=A0A0E0MGF6_ORYPU
MLSGTIPTNAFATLPQLEQLFLDHNKFHGYFPVSLANASNLSVIQIGANFLSGVVPPEIGRLRNLKWLTLAETLIEAKDPQDWKFITALTNCSQLEHLLLGSCQFGGQLPDSLSNLSTSLINLQVYSNKISGSLPKDIGNLINLRTLSLHKNYFTGILPSSLTRLASLNAFSARSNRIGGEIPLNIGNLTELTKFILNGNAFSGRIPSTLGNLSKLLALDLASNHFTGSVPSELFSIPTLSIILNLYSSNLEGPIPQEIGNLKNLVEFNAESNKLSGEILASIGECELLQNVYLDNNLLNGTIPPSLSLLKGLTAVDLSNNNLSGHIPKFLGNFTTLYYLNLSFNSFIGEVPKCGVFENASAISIQGNDKLCGGVPDLHLPPCPSELRRRMHKSSLVPIVVSLTATTVVLSMICAFFSCRKSTTKIPLITSMQGHPLISYPQLARATDGFSNTNLLGSGTFGTVFMPKMVKVLKLQTPGALKSFTAECEALRNLRHRNLVKIITACSSIDNTGNDFKAIVLDFMPNGNLEGWLHPDKSDQTEHRYLNLLERVSILLDVAYALDYLHWNGPTPVVHCDLKSSNVLLDADMVAHVGDFGLAKILVEGSSMFKQSTSSMGFRGTIEYGAGNMVSTNGDIYSYGILVLEAVTGKKPAGSEFRQGLSLREYVKFGLQDDVMGIVDVHLSMDLTNGLPTENDATYKRKAECIVLLLKLGMSCSQELPSSRSSTGDIVRELLAIKESLSSEHRT